MRPSILAVVAVAVLAVAGAWSALAARPSAAPAGVLAEDTIMITVGERTSGLLALTGPQVSLLLGLALLLIAGGWALARLPSRTTDEVTVDE
jgi:hypothetical protein